MLRPKLPLCFEPAIMYRQFSRWAKVNRRRSANYTDFLWELEGWGFYLDGNRMVMGLVLTKDLSRPATTSVKAERRTVSNATRAPKFESE